MIKPRIVFATTVFEPISTGPAVFAHYLWEAFREDSSIDFHLVTAVAAEEHPRLHVVGSSTKSSDVVRKVQQRALELAAGRETETVIHGNACHSMGSFLRYPGPWMAQVNDYAVANVYHKPSTLFTSSGLRRFLSLVWRHRVESMVVNAATRIVCNSQYTRSMVLKHYRVARPERVVKIYKAVDLSAFQRPQVPTPDPFPSRPKGARLVFAGSHWRIKGLHHLIQAIAHVAAQVPNVHLTVAGECNPGRPSLFIKLADRLRVSDRIFFAGQLDRRLLADTFFHSDIFVLPSVDEALGVAALEALAAGLPVVASRVGGIPEIVPDTCGLLCQPGSSMELGEAVIQLLKDPRRRMAMARSAPKKAAQFSKEVMIEEVKNLYVALAKA